jgi:methionyl aminopeptidase
VGKPTIRHRPTIKTAEQLELMRQAGRVVAQALAAVAQEVRPGLTTADLDRLAEEVIRAAGCVPSFKGYHGFPATLCTSINDEIVHGIPSDERVLREGDLVKIDCGAIFRGWHGDAAISVPVGEVDGATARLSRATAEALVRGIEASRSGGRVSDIGQAVEAYARGQGYQVVRQCVGHGIGRHLHEEPPVPNYGPAGQGPVMRPGMVLAIEPMLNAGTWEVETQADGWTIKTADGHRSAHFEHTVAITDDGPRILTLP